MTTRFRPTQPDWFPVFSEEASISLTAEQRRYHCGVQDMVEAALRMFEVKILKASTMQGKVKRYSFTFAGTATEILIKYSDADAELAIWMEVATMSLAAAECATWKGRAIFLEPNYGIQLAWVGDGLVTVQLISSFNSSRFDEESLYDLIFAGLDLALHYRATLNAKPAA